MLRWVDVFEGDIDQKVVWSWWVGSDISIVAAITSSAMHTVDNSSPTTQGQPRCTRSRAIIKTGCCRSDQ